MQPITGQLPFIPAAHHDGARSLSGVRFLVVHDTESPDHGGKADAPGVAHFFANPPNLDVGSAQIVVDDESAVRCLADVTIPWAAPPCNTDGLHLEICSFASWTREEWLAHRLSLYRAAYHFAIWSKITGIPLRFLDSAEIVKPGIRGVTTHRVISAAFHQSTHTDPGPNFPMTYFLDVAQAYRAIVLSG